MGRSDRLTDPALLARLQALEDREAIRELIAQYGPLADSGDAHSVAALWSEDGIYAVDGFGESQGQAAIARLIEGSAHQALMAAGCAHLLGPVSINLTGDTASARGHSRAGASHAATMPCLMARLQRACFFRFILPVDHHRW